MSINNRRVANRKEALKRSRNWPQINDITLDVSVAVLTTLKGVAKICAVPFLSNAASIALSIFDVVQKMRGNKHGFKELATDSCQIVHEVIKAQQAVSQLGGISVDLEENIRQLVNVLHVIMAFAQKGASRNFFSAMIRYNADARRIQEYRRKLYQAIQIFGLQSDITLRKTVAQLAENQVAMANQLNSIAARVLAPPPCMPSSSPIVPVWGIPNNIPRLMNYPTLFHAETVHRMDNDVISTDITGGQDNEFGALYHYVMYA